MKIAQAECGGSKSPHLKKDSSGLWRYHGRVPDYNPIFIPRKHLLAEKIIENRHRQNLHGGVQSTIAKVREQFWIPRIRRLTNRIRSQCNICRFYQVKPLPSPNKFPDLPDFRAKFTDPFAAIGVDFAGPFLYKNGSKNTDKGKAYIALFTCAATRGIHIKVCKDMTTSEFKCALKEVIARRGIPQLIVSDNAKTFIATNKWLKLLQKDDDMNNYLATNNIEWRFNMSRAPWWGGFFERLIGVMKSTLAKVIGNALLSYKELEEVFLDVECHMNNRPLCYVGEDFENQVVTPNILIRGKTSVLLDESTLCFDDVSVKEVRKRLRFLQKCKDGIRK